LPRYAAPPGSLKASAIRQAGEIDARARKRVDADWRVEVRPFDSTIPSVTGVAIARQLALLDVHQPHFRYAVLSIAVVRLDREAVAVRLVEGCRGHAALPEKRAVGSFTRYSGRIRIDTISLPNRRFVDRYVEYYGMEL
jgi:hypothetical protein